ncbi:hemin ABC transporter substrate-binding protein, partial [Corallococcus llansteffanensis]
MKRTASQWGLFAALLALAAHAAAPEPKKAEPKAAPKLVTVGPAVTQTVFALGVG